MSRKKKRASQKQTAPPPAPVMVPSYGTGSSVSILARSSSSGAILFGDRMLTRWATRSPKLLRTTSTSYATSGNRRPLSLPSSTRRRCTVQEPKSYGGPH